MTTTNITRDDIRKLRDEAGVAGDLDEVALCNRALDDDDAEALEACRKRIKDWRAECKYQDELDARTTPPREPPT